MLCEILHLNKSSVYSRIKGDRLLKVDELLLLARMSGFHLDQHIFKETGTVILRFGFLAAPVRSCREPSE